jgi:hypothetical protein
MWTRILGSIVLVVVASALLFEIQLIVDIRSFEYRYIFDLLGAKGLTIVLLFHVLAVSVFYWSLTAIQIFQLPRVRLSVAAVTMFVPAVVFAWFLDWVLLEEPLSATNRDTDILFDRRSEVQDAAAKYALEHGGIHLLLEATGSGLSPNEDNVAVLMARVVINHPGSFESAPIGSVISKYSDKYGVSPTLLLAWAYLDSFYGEAKSGPMPFFRSMTGETFRDFVQVHLPPWVIESRTRIFLIQSDWLEQLAGQGLGSKLRYALHKATYDVSVDPYDTNIYSDVFLMLQTFPNEFPELIHPKSEIDEALKSSFNALRGSVLSQSCHSPYDQPLRDDQFYDVNRDHLTTFARAIFYKLLSDFDFATRVQALVIKYYDQLFEHRLGAPTWEKIGSRQQAALVAILRDVFVPNIGRLSGNVYLLPELNCTPFEFVAEEAVWADLTVQDKLWIPEEREKLWAAATYKLRNLGEVWQVITGEEFNIGEPVTDTISDSEAVISRNIDRLDWHFSGASNNR